MHCETLPLEARSKDDVELKLKQRSVRERTRDFASVLLRDLNHNPPSFFVNCSTVQDSSSSSSLPCRSCCPDPSSSSSNRRRTFELASRPPSYRCRSTSRRKRASTSMLTFFDSSDALSGPLLRDMGLCLVDAGPAEPVERTEESGKEESRC